MAQASSVQEKAKDSSNRPSRVIEYHAWPCNHMEWSICHLAGVGLCHLSERAEGRQPGCTFNPTQITTVHTFLNNPNNMTCAIVFKNTSHLSARDQIKWRSEMCLKMNSQSRADHLLNQVSLSPAMTQSRCESPSSVCLFI